MVDASGRACLTDFGLAQNHGAAGESYIMAGGTARWTAPEILKEKGSSSKGADVFSFAMVIVEVGCGEFDNYQGMASD
jgi:serine/threonine protein kinase